MVTAVDARVLGWRWSLQLAVAMSVSIPLVANHRVGADLVLAGSGMF